MKPLHEMSREERFNYAFDKSTTEEQVAHMYGAWAETFDTDGDRHMYTGILTALAWSWFKDSRTKILDIGCGTGLAVEPLAALGYTNITGIDNAPEMAEIADDKDIYESVEVMSADKLDFADNKFEGAIATGCFTPGHAPVSALKEVARVLRPGSHFIVSLRVHDVFDYRYEISRLFNMEYETSPFRPFPRTVPDIIATMVVCTL